MLVDMPKIREKEIIRLEADEVASLLDFVEHGGDHLTGQKLAYYEKTKERDLAIITLLLGTGIRVSELVGLNVDDVDFRNNGLHLIRKGRKEMTVYFGNEVADALEQYMEGSRKLIIPKEGHEDALFYSMQRRRIGVQAVQNLVKKYAKEVTPLKKITPHKLRSTYGTALYQETDDIYLVAEVLGHSDVNTTRKHYAAMSDTRRRQAAGKVVLRESASHDVDGQKHFHRDGHVLADDVESHLRDHFGDDRVDLARHDRGTGLQPGQVDLIDAVRGPEDSRRRSLQILDSLTAMRLSTPEVCT